MNKRKARELVVNADMQRVLQLVKQSNGVLSSEIATALGISGRYASRLLIALRNRGEVFSTLVNPVKRVHNWTAYPLPKESEYDPLYPDLDSEHLNWCKKVRIGKIRYNPWGPSNANT